MIGDEFTAPAPAGARPVEYASFGRRLTAALLDSAVWIIGLIFFNPFVFIGDSAAAGLLVSLVVFSAWFNYFAFCEWRWGQTIGKNAMGIRVLPLQGGSLSWQVAAIRNLLRLVDLPLAMVGVDYVIVRSSQRRQRLGDRAAKTIVVREQPAEAPAAFATAGATPAPSVGVNAPTARDLRRRGAGARPASGCRLVAHPPAPAPQGASVAPPVAAVPRHGRGREGIAARVTWTPGSPSAAS